MPDNEHTILLQLAARRIATLLTEKSGLPINLLVSYDENAENYSAVASKYKKELSAIKVVRPKH